MPQYWQASGGSRLHKLGLAFVLASAIASSVGARTASTELATVSLSQLPPEARETRALIDSGGPFPFRKDGTVFGNRERLLPQQPRGYYREYTVRTQDAVDRGARRIVCGGVVPRLPDACFYTADHYASFRRIVQ